jgi:hypothetical protein
MKWNRTHAQRYPEKNAKKANDAQVPQTGNSDVQQTPLSMCFIDFLSGWRAYGAEVGEKHRYAHKFPKTFTEAGVL